LDCEQRKDLILLYLAGALDAGEAAELREHMAGGCPVCAGHWAEAEATLAMLPLSLPAQPTPPALKYSILNKARAMRSRSGRNWDWAILSGAVAAVLAVAVTLAVVNRFWPKPGSASADQATADRATIVSLKAQLALAQGQLGTVHQALEGLRFAELTGPVQPRAVGHVFIDVQMKKWYFFACGMKPAPGGETYELWLVCNDQKIPAGVFDVSEQGSAALLGAVPPMPPGATVSLAVTDEPINGPHQQPTGQMQMKGIVE
jgi:anti-sigma-K factor RskA